MQLSCRNNFFNRPKTRASMIKRLPPALVALLVQCLALLAIVLAANAIPAQIFGIFEWAILQGITAATISYLLKMPLWWLPIHFVFTPAIIATLMLDISPLWFFGAFIATVLIYGKTYQTQVPLYLTSREAAKTLTTLLPEQKKFTFIDLGCGHGGLLKNIASHRPDGNYEGVEAAPIPCILGKLHSMISKSNMTIRWGDLWKQKLSSYDVVYAYLSPVPMQALWRKVCREMRPGSIFISNSFIVPGKTPEKSIKLNDFTGSTLYLWRIDNDNK